MKSMIFMSNQHAADQVIIALGYPYLNGALRDAGFFEPAPLSSGIWISGSYDSHDWAKDDVFELSTRGQKHYQQKTNFVGTARQFATLLALLDRRLLFDATAAECNEMKEILRKDHRGTDPIDNCFVRLAVEGTPGITLETWASKIGIGVRGTNQPGMKGFHDCAIVERKKGAITLRYVLVIAGGLSDDTLPEGTPDPQTTGWYKFIRHLDGIVAKQHP
jgi:hypothetical protein